MLRGLDPRRHELLKRESPRTLFGINRQHNEGHSLARQQEDSREPLLLQYRRLYDAQRGISACGRDLHRRPIGGRAGTSLLQVLS